MPDLVVLGAGNLQATFVPALGMIGSSLRHRGAELLGQRGGLEKYAASGSTMGIPLLHPWANRLVGYAYRGVTIDPANPRLHRDGNGLPMHGLLAALRWTVVERAADRLVAEFDFTAADLLSAFPFPHRLAMTVTLDAGALHVATTLHATGDVAVPISFGYHPYLTLPDVARADWQIDAAVGRHLLLDARGIPTGATEPSAVAAGPLGDRTFDDLYEAGAGRLTLTGGGRQITVTFDEGYPYAQLYAPAAEPVICFEPMTAPTNALISSTALRAVAPGQSFTARFSIAATMG